MMEEEISPDNFHGWEGVKARIKSGRLGPLAEFIFLAEKDPVLGKLFPFTSHDWIGFGKNSQYPFDADRPFVMAKVEGDGHMMGSPLPRMRPKASICANCERRIPGTIHDGCCFRDAKDGQAIASVVQTMSDEFRVPPNCDKLDDQIVANIVFTVSRAAPMTVIYRGSAKGALAVVKGEKP